MSTDQASFRRLIDIGIALSAERDSDRLMERILLEAKDMGQADGGTLYIRNRDDQLEFKIVRTDSLGLAQGGTTGNEISLPPVNMFSEDGSPNNQNIVTYAANTGETINIADACDSDQYWPRR